MYALTDMLRFGLPWPGIDREVAMWRLRNLPNFWRGFWRIALARLFGLPHTYGQLSLVLYRGDGTRVDYGLVSLRVITDDGVGFIIDAWRNAVELETMRYHAFGSGVTAEAIGDHTLVTEFSSQYESGNLRPQGSLGKLGGTAFRTVALFTPSANVAVTEHGLFSQEPTGGGVLFDRSKFSVINLDSTKIDTLQSTYDCNFPSGG